LTDGDQLEVDAMPIVQVDPPEASRLMGEGYVYLDVRSTSEFARGHAQGAVNAPLLETDPAGGLAPNPDFLAVCMANFAKDMRLVVGCASGGRSQKACELLEANGYTTLANVRGGFSGARDRTGRVLARGWAELGLPVSMEVGEGVSYESLERKAGR
jgi:rhodanese-related sulfurtransferase